MHLRTILRTTCVFATLLFATTMPARLAAQADEIQVYTGGLANPGVFNVTIHTNFTPNGGKNPSFPGGVTPNHSLNGVPEFAYGVSDWLEAGLYLPLYSLDRDLGFSLDGFKLRALVARPHGDDRTFVYGLGFEYSVNAKRWDPNRISSEIRPIIGWHLNPVDMIVNPIFDTEYDGLRNLVFAPSLRVAYNFKSTWAAALEEYADFGTVHAFASRSQQSHQIYGVIDHAGKTWDIEAGVGAGLTKVADKLTLKLIIARDLHKFSR
jgi:hypothetical protein